MFSGEIGSFAAATIVRSCPGDWKQGDGAPLACMTRQLSGRHLPLQLAVPK
jgi:hypothetical protein